MATRIEPVANTSNMKRLIVEDLDGGMSTRTSAEKISENRAEYVLNGIFFQDGMILKRSGNTSFAATGSGQPLDAMGCLLADDPTAGSTLVSKTNGALYAKNENTGAAGAWSKISGATAFGATGTHMTFAQMYDPAFSTGASKILICCDGTQPPYGYDGAHFQPLNGANMPKNRAGSATITPKYVIEWGPHLVFAGEPTEPTAVYISDALNPESFSSFGFYDSAAVGYIPYFPAGRDASCGPIQGLAVINGLLLVFFTNAIVIGTNTGSYGAMNYQWRYLSHSIGTVNGATIVAMEHYIIFYTGTRFYCTDGNDIYALPDELPTYYNFEPQSWYAAQLPIANFGVLSACRVGDQYWLCTSGGNEVLVFDTTASGGFVPGQQSDERPDVQATGGTWSIFTMPVACGLFLQVGYQGVPRFYWGAGNIDKTYQYGSGFSDDGQPYRFEVRSRAFYMGAPNAPATVQSVSAKLVYPDQVGVQFASTPTLYAYVDRVQYNCPASNIVVPVTPSLTPRSTRPVSVTSNPSTAAQGYAVQLGVTDNSINPIGIMSLQAEVSADEPRPTF